jgi:hypothetical protein
MSKEQVDGVKLFDPETDTLYTTAKVAELFSVTQETVRDWISDGKLPAIRLRSGHLRVTRRELVAFANHRFGGESLVSE